MRATVMTHTHAKGQKSFSSKVRVETDGETDGRTYAEAIALGYPPC